MIINTYIYISAKDCPWRGDKEPRCDPACQAAYKIDDSEADGRQCRGSRARERTSSLVCYVDAAWKKQRGNAKPTDAPYHAVFPSRQPSLRNVSLSLSPSLSPSLCVRVYPLSISLIHPCAWTNLLIENLERRSCDIMDDRLDIVQRKIINSRSFVSSMDGITVNLVWPGEAC